MLKIRLMRIGAKKRPFYRVVVVEERSKRTGGYIELLGTYNPLSEPKEIKLKQDRIDYWTKMGAQPSIGFLRIIGKAPQRLPRKPKKEKKKVQATPEPAKATVSTEEPTPKTEEQLEKPKESAVVETPVANPVIPSSNEKSKDSSGDSSPTEPIQSDKEGSEKKDERST